MTDMKKKNCQAIESNVFDLYLRSHETFIKFFLFVIGLSVFWNSVWGDFVFDDAEAIVNNDDVQGTAPFWKLFYNDFWGSLINQNYSHKSYRPLTVITFRLNWVTFGKSAFSFHLVNIILHAICSSLSYNVILVLIRGHSPSTALCTALLFTVHPIHCESVAGIVGRADLLAALLGFNSILLYKQATHASNGLRRMCVLTGIAALLCVGAMLCKEQGITILGILSVYDLFIVNKLSLSLHNLIFNPRISLSLSKPHRARPLWIRQGVLVSVGVLALYLRWCIMGSAPPTFKPIDNPASFHEQFLMRVLNYNYIYAVNVWLLLCPEWLCNDWSMGSVPLIQSWSDYRVGFVLLFWTALLGLLVRVVLSLFSQQSRRDLLIALSLIIVPFLPASNLLFRVGFVIAERNLYIPSLGFCLLVVLGVMRALHTFTKHSHNLFAGFIFIVFILSVRTVNRNEDWMNEVRLYESAIRVSPLNAKMHFNLGRQAAEQNLYPLAVGYYRESIRLNPTYAQAMNNLANLLRLDQPREAEVLFKKAVKYEPELSSAWNNLGILLNSQKRFEEAERCYAEAVRVGRLRKKKADYLYNLGNMFLDMGDRTKALNTWINVTLLDPLHVKSWHNIIIMFDSLGNFSTSVIMAERALRVLPREATLHADLAYSLVQAKRFNEAEAHYKAAILLKPNMAVFHANFGVFYQLTREYDKAEHQYLKALALDPSYKKVHENYASLKQTMTKMNKQSMTKLNKCRQGNKRSSS
uniref:dolichyl-phosphate-mannose--protein mannosyltransferase n=1 Tax=Cacopsylla melanoneura TaxID=428564 RepID=A0A8D9AGM0_9HEMI